MLQANVAAKILKHLGVETPFEVELAFTRPNDIANYAVGDLYNASTTSVVLPEFDFTLANANRPIRVEQVFITVSGNSTGTLTFTFRLYNANTITGQDLGDNQPFNPSFAEDVLKSLMVGLPSKLNNGTNCYNLGQYEMNRTLTIPSTGKVGLVLTTNQAIAPIASQQISVRLRGVYLSMD